MDQKLEVARTDPDEVVKVVGERRPVDDGSSKQLQPSLVSLSSDRCHDAVAFEVAWPLEEVPELDPQWRMSPVALWVQVSPSDQAQLV